MRLVTGSGDYRPYGKLVAAAARNVGLTPDLADVLLSQWRELRPWPDVPTMLARLTHPLATATNCPKVLERLGAATLGNPFSVVVSAERAGAYKPEPRPYQLALDELGLPAERVLFVAGSSHDAVGAVRMGMLVRLRQVRQWLFVTQAELAERTGVAEATLSRIENGLQRPRISTVRKIADALGVRPEELVEWDDETTNGELGKAAA